jgi:hypothetical protein
MCNYTCVRAKKGGNYCSLQLEVSESQNRWLVEEENLNRRRKRGWERALALRSAKAGVTAGKNEEFLCDTLAGAGALRY